MIQREPIIQGLFGEINTQQESEGSTIYYPG